MSTAPASTVSAAPAALVSVRRAAEGDRQALVRMLARCSAETRYRRFHGPVKLFPQRYLTEALSGRPVHFALVATAGEDVVALASCRAVDEGVAELGVLVEDAWQRRGIGGRLLREIGDFAAQTGLRALQAQLLAEQPWVAGLLRRYGPCHTVATGNLLLVTARLPR